MSYYSFAQPEKFFDKRRGINTYEYARVSEECFNYYLKFLQTKNPGYLRQAERERV